MFDTYAATAKRTTRSRMIMTFESVCGWSNTCRVDVQRLRWKPRDRHALENVLCTRQPPHSQGLGRYGQRLACPEVRLPAVVWRGTLTRAGRREAQEEVALLEARGRGRPVGGLHRLLVARRPGATLLRSQQVRRQPAARATDVRRLDRMWQAEAEARRDVPGEMVRGATGRATGRGERGCGRTSALAATRARTPRAR